MAGFRFASVLVAGFILYGCASAPPPPAQPVGLAGLPPTITVSEWPFWVDIPIETKDYDRTWKTLIDIVSEKAAIGVLDKESGYIRTEWRPVDVSTAMVVTGRDERNRPIAVTANMTGEQRYTFRVRQSESKIRMGIEARIMPSQRWASGLRNLPNAPWVSIHRELQDRLVNR
jgi:hypothetical protein